jgi:general secretion pathway protein N
MTRGRIAIIFVALLLAALVLTLPLALVLPDRALSARAATGTIWSGRLNEAHVGRVALGDLEVGVRPLALLTGSVRARVSGALGKGEIVGGRGIANMTARLPVATLFAPVPLTELEFDSVSAVFERGRCEQATGRVRATFVGDIGGLSLAQGLSGIARCEGGLLLLPLVSQSAMERMNLRVAGNGSYTAELIVRSTDPMLAAKLAASGFASTQAGYVLRLSGTL